MKKVLICATLLAFFLAFQNTAYSQTQALKSPVAKEAPKEAQTALLAQPSPKPETRPTFDFKNPGDWIELGKNSGLAITAVAKEVGVAADKLLDSNAGKIAVVLIAAKMMDVKAGNIGDVVSRITAFVTGMGLLFIFLPIWGWYFRHLCVIKEVKKLGFWKKEVLYHDLTDENVRRQRLIMVGILFLTVAFTVSLAFGSGIFWYALAGITGIGVVAIFVGTIFFALTEHQRPKGGNKATSAAKVGG